MCARTTLSTPASTLQRLFEFTNALESEARFNIAPAQDVVVVRADQGGRVACRMRWGAAAPGRPLLVNARSETAAQKPAFAEALRRRRGLVLADGFYEWRTEGRARQPWHFALADGAPFGIAALWQPARDGQPETCVLLTTAPNPLVGQLHDRMPVIVPPAQAGAWLDPSMDDPARLAPLLGAFPAERMRARPVSMRVNDVRHEGPELLAPPEQRSLF